jgi:hypothetical protein
VHQISPGATAVQSTGWVRYLFDRWDLDARQVTAAELTAGALAEVDVLVLPDGDAAAATQALGEAGLGALRAWVQGGGRLVAWKGGGVLAAAAGVTTVQFTEPAAAGITIPGTLFRVLADRRSGLAEGAGRSLWAMNVGDRVMRQPDRAKVVVRYPAEEGRFAYSGFAVGAENLRGTTAVSDEAVGEGRATVFAFDPNFRAFTHGTQTLLRNALAGDLAPPPATAVAQAASRARAMASTRRLSTLADPLVLTVRAPGAHAAERVLARFGATAETTRADGRVTFRIANPGGLTADQHPWARLLPRALEGAGVPVVAYRVP